MDEKIALYQSRKNLSNLQMQSVKGYIEALYTELVECIDMPNSNVVFKQFILYYLGHIVKSEHIKLPTWRMYAKRLWVMQKAFLMTFYF